MHTNLYFVVEYRPRAKRRRKWWTFFRLSDTGDGPILHTLLGSDEAADLPEIDRLKIIGLPDDVCERSLDEDAFTVDDDAAKSDIGELLDDVRFCSRAEAAEWVAAGEARYINNGYKVTDPEAYGHSSASFVQLEQLVGLSTKYPVECIELLRAVVGSMRSLENDGYETRIVYWFS